MLIAATWTYAFSAYYDAIFISPFAVSQSAERAGFVSKIYLMPLSFSVV